MLRHASAATALRLGRGAEGTNLRNRDSVFLMVLLCFLADEGRGCSCVRGRDPSEYHPVVLRGEKS